MSAADQQLHPGHYRLAPGVHIVSQNGSKVAICDYPLRIVRLNPIIANVLTFCSEEYTCEQLAQAAHIPLKRIEILCDQLRWKGLLEAGPLLPPPLWPSVSIVIPTYNRVKELERCLHSLFALVYPTDCLEIVIVDDGSTDETSTMLQQLLHETPAFEQAVRIICHEQRQGVAISRNSGAEVAKYELIAYIDSDCVASPDWLRELVPAFQDTQIGAVGGMIRAYDRKTLLGRYEDVRSSLYMGKRSQQVSLKGPLTYVPTANMVVRRTIWQDLAGFAPLTQGEDVDFCRRLLMSGAGMLYIAQGTVYHDYRTTIDAFLHIRATYASAEAALLNRYPTDRRILLLPPEQTIFAIAMFGGMCGILWFIVHSILSGLQNMTLVLAFLSFLLMLFLILYSTFTRLHKAKAYVSIIMLPIVIKAVLRGHLAFTYHLCRHLIRYYTLPLLIVSIFVPQIFILLLILCSIVIGVDYVRLKPEVNAGSYAFCSLIDDCAYEVGVVWGCMKYGTWKPLVPVIKV